MIEFFTPDQGRLSLLARGARVSQRRFGGVLDQFSRLRAVVSPGRELWTLYEVAPLSLRLNLRNNLEAINRANVLVEWAQVLVPFQQAAPDFFRFFDHALNLLDAGELSRAVGVYPRMLAESGLLPELRGCAQCGEPAGAGAPASLRAEVGLLCGACSSRRELLSPMALEVVRGGRCESESVALEVERALSRWLQAEMGQPLRTLGL